jgi:hypothetical protein
MFVASSRPSTSRLSADSCNAKVAGTDFHPDLAKLAQNRFNKALKFKSTSVTEV